MRILFKTPHQLMFRRCFFVKSEMLVEIGGEYFKRVVHGLKGRKETDIPVIGTVFRRFGKK